MGVAVAVAGDVARAGVGDISGAVGGGGGGGGGIGALMVAATSSNGTKRDRARARQRLVVALPLKWQRAWDGSGDVSPEAKLAEAGAKENQRVSRLNIFLAAALLCLRRCLETALLLLFTQKLLSAALLRGLVEPLVWATRAHLGWLVMVVGCGWVVGECGRGVEFGGLNFRVFL